jgi:hypothetical protein
MLTSEDLEAGACFQKELQSPFFSTTLALLGKG